MPVYTKGDVKILHIHTPKTGGSSVMNLFEQDNYKVTYFSTDKSKCSPQHRHFELLRKNHNIKDFDYVFSTYRDPIDRLKSEYKFQFEIHNKRVLPFDEWVLDIFKKYQYNNFILDNHIRPQSEFYSDDMTVYPFNISFIRQDLINKSFLSDKTILKWIHKTHSTINASTETIEHIKNFYSEDYQWKKIFLEDYKPANDHQKKS